MADRDLNSRTVTDAQQSADPEGHRAKRSAEGERARPDSPIRAIRECAGLSQEWAAIKAGVRQSTVSRLESRGLHVRLDTMQRFAEALGVTLSWSVSADEPGPE